MDTVKESAAKAAEQIQEKLPQADTVKESISQAQEKIQDAGAQAAEAVKAQAGQMGQAGHKRPRVFFDISIGGTKAGRVVFELVSIPVGIGVV